VADHRAMKLGKRPPRRDPRVPVLARYTEAIALPSPPDNVDWYSKVATWPMMMNDAIGDCAIAGAGHAIEQWTTYANTTPRIFSDEEAQALYSIVGGYVPGNPATDQGVVELDLLDWWRDKGISSDRLAAFAAVKWDDPVGVKQAIHWFGNLYLGLALPLSAQQQEVWDVPREGAVGAAAAGSWGGHCVLAVGYDADGLTCVTWGALKRLTWTFLAAYADEAYALLSRDFVEACGTSADSLDWNQLEAGMTELKLAG
jgi:hypothetical protein